MSTQLHERILARLFGERASKAARPVSRRRKREPRLENLEGRQVLSTIGMHHALADAHHHAEVARPFATSGGSQAFKQLSPILGTWQTQTFFTAYATSTIPTVPAVVSTTDVYVRFGNAVLKTVDGTRQGFAGDNLKIQPTGGVKVQLQFYHPGTSTLPVAILNGVRTGYASWVFTGSAPLDPSNPSSTANVRLTYSFITRQQRSFTNEVLVNNQYQLLYTSISTKTA